MIGGYLFYNTDDGRLYLGRGDGEWEVLSHDFQERMMTGPTTIQLEERQMATEQALEYQVGFLEDRLQQVGAKCDTMAKRLEEALDIDVSDLI